MDEWTDSVRIAVDVFVACVIISALLLCMTLGHKISNYMELQQAAAADVKDFRTANAYEGTTVYAQDVTNLILVSDGFPAITVHTLDGTDKTWNRTHADSDYTTTSINQVIGVDSWFTCTLNYNANGVLEEYYFTQKAPPTSGGVNP